ncbi:MAG TPA: carboxypeptidase-like regulatory domain-containing protein, partial [Gemmatimonadales bacterium]|nr:carboxypeptidase-like regulatory domain-containing protein [Gemmatimonadales bacterium]
MPYSARFLLAFLTLSTLTAAAAAQKAPKPLPIMRGAVQDTLGKGIEGAQVEIHGLNRVITTPGSGAYRFDAIQPGKYWVTARRIGYAPIHTALSFNAGDDRQIVFRLEPLPYNLPELRVRAEDKAWTRKYQEFLWRSRTSFYGHFLTRDDIERAHPNYLGDVVRRYL